ncbi:unnamed protein product, partial [Gulo gulo]
PNPQALRSQTSSPQSCEQYRCTVEAPVWGGVMASQTLEKGVPLACRIPQTSSKGSFDRYFHFSRESTEALAFKTGAWPRARGRHRYLSQ